MKGDPEFVILKHTAWLDTEKFESKILGSIVRRPLNPTSDYVPANPLQYNDHNLVQPTEPLTDFALENTNMDSKHASAKLSSIADLNFSGETTESVKLAGKVITYKKISQISEFWDKLLQDKAVGDKVPGWAEKTVRHPPCLVVGIMIAEDVDLDTSGASQREKDGKVDFPLATVVGAATATPLPPGIGDVRVAAGTKHNSTTVFRAKAGKSNIFALELQTVKLSGAWYKRTKKLVLSDDGPEFSEGRLAGDEDGGDEPLVSPKAEDLVLGGSFSSIA